MVGVIGVNRRIFTALADNGINVFLVSQASSENSTSIGVRNEDAEEAVEVLNNEFASEITDGAMFPMHLESNLATIAIVGENMKHTPVSPKTLRHIRPQRYLRHRLCSGWFRDQHIFCRGLSLSA